MSLGDDVVVALCDEISLPEVTLISPNREDIFLFAGTPAEVRKKIGMTTT